MEKERKKKINTERDKGRKTKGEKQDRREKERGKREGRKEERKKKRRRERTRRTTKITYNRESLQEFIKINTYSITGIFLER